MQIGAARFDAKRGSVLRDGTEVTLRAKSAEVLAYLMRHPGRIVTRGELFDAVWPGLAVTDDSLTQCVVELRRALGPEAAALMRTVPRRGYLLDVPPEAGVPAVPAPAPTPELGSRPVLAVLPFANLAGDPRWDRLCNGLVEDMITAFARHPHLLVIARTSSFAVARNPDLDIRAMGKALGAGFLLEGSVQADLGRVAVTAQLIDAVTGGHVWAERYEEEERGLFDIQLAVVARVIHAVLRLGGMSRETISEPVWAGPPPASLAAYELYLRGYEEEARLDREGTLLAIPLLRAAIELAPGFSRAWTTLSLALGNAVANRWADDVAAARQERARAVRRAVELDPEDGIALEELGTVLMREGDRDGAARAFEAAARRGANHADTLALLAKYMVEVLDQGEAALKMTRRSFLLNPLAPSWYRLGAARVTYFTGAFEETIDQAALAPALRVPRLMRMLALARLGRGIEAAEALAEHRARFGEDGIESAVASLPPLCERARAGLDEGLREAGLAPATEAAARA